MHKLLSANFARLRKDRFLWCLLAAVLVLSLVNTGNSVRSFQTMAESGYGVSPEKYYFSQAPYMGFFFALFASMFLGTEYADGTIRNKLAVGHRRNQVFLSGYLTSLAASLIILAVWLTACCPIFFLTGPMNMSGLEFTAYILITAGFSASLTALFTLVGSLSSNKAMTIVYTLALFILMILLASGINDRLCEPETQGGMAYIDGAFTMVEPSPNPLYLSGAVRSFWTWVLDFLPTGQAILMRDTAIEHPLRELGSSVLLTGIVLFAGCGAFRRKDIK